MSPKALTGRLLPQAAQEANGELLALVGSAADAEAERLEVADLLLVIGGQLSSPVSALCEA